MIFVTYRRNAVSTQKSTKKASAPFQLRLDNELRGAIEEARKQDCDDSIAGWMKRTLRKELINRGILK
ncbi:hypothetical protein DN601_03295 [Klebsiella quasipneumoniae subsp. similipneumoniae]|nr:hypothetical protein [Klebsiella quasipneumoniae]RWT66307.1 hypothetical protein DN601_03295 [Klebsiella quasipneumoniae subsp. similipneumoniae]